VQWTDISQAFWVSTGIDWKKSHAESRTTAYSHILIDTESLLQCFPITDAEAEAPVGIVKVGSSYILQPGHLRAVSPSKRGRPAFKWDEFHVEVARRLASIGLPTKQEAFIADMQGWCRQQWGRDVGRSTILEKVKSYYGLHIGKDGK